MKLKPFIRIDKELALHLAQPELTAAIFEAVNQNRLHLREWLPWVDSTNDTADTSRFIEFAMEQNTAGTQLITFIACGDRLAGSVAVVKFKAEARSCEIGYWLCSDLQRRGIMTRACNALIDYLFRQKALNRIEIFAASGNANSRAVCQRLGAVHEGTLRQGLWLYDTFHDLELYAILKRDWRPQT